MEIPNGKYAWMVKIGEKGQFVIPKEAREMFDLQPGTEIPLDPSVDGNKIMESVANEQTTEESTEVATN